MAAVTNEKDCVKFKGKSRIFVVSLFSATYGNSVMATKLQLSRYYEG